jgi:predicted RNA-binding protein with PUA-like domain
MKNYWVVKSEPESYSWQTFVSERKTNWTGVRNFQARNNLKAMKAGDLVFFYHSVSEKQIVGVAKVTKESSPDPTADEGSWLAVELAPVTALVKTVTLEQIKADPVFKDMPLVRASRLSVSPLTPEQGKHVLKLGQTEL